jgi:hypothetical protein
LNTVISEVGVDIASVPLQAAREHPNVFTQRADALSTPSNIVALNGGLPRICSIRDETATTLTTREGQLLYVDMKKFHKRLHDDPHCPTRPSN